MAQSKLDILLSLQDQASAGLKSFNSRLESVSKHAKIAGAALSAFAVGGGVAITNFTKAALVQQKALQAVAVAVENTGVSFSAYEDRIRSTTQALQDKTNFGDEEQLRALSRMIPIIGDVDRALAALPAVIDGAASSGSSLETVAGTLSRALSGQANTAESVGLTFDKTETFAERLERTLAAVGGTAESQADPFVQLGNTVGDLREAIGEQLLPIITPLLERFAAVVRGLRDMDPQLVRMGALVLAGATAFAAIAGPMLLFIGFLPAIVTGLGLVTGAFTALLGPIGVIGAAVVALAVAWQTNFMGIRDFTTKVVNAIGGVLETLKGWFQGVLRFVGRVINEVINQIEFGINSIIRAINRIPDIDVFGKTLGIPEITEVALPRLEQIGKVVGDVFVAIKDKALDVGEGIRDFVMPVMDSFNAKVQSVDDSVRNLGASFEDTADKATKARAAFGAGSFGLENRRGAFAEAAAVGRILGGQDALAAVGETRILRQALQLQPGQLLPLEAIRQIVSELMGQMFTQDAAMVPIDRIASVLSERLPTVVVEIDGRELATVVGQGVFQEEQVQSQ